MSKIVLYMLGKSLCLTEVDDNGNKKEHLFTAEVIDYKSLMPMDLTEIEKIIKKRKE